MHSFPVEITPEIKPTPVINATEERGAEPQSQSNEDVDLDAHEPRDRAAETSESKVARIPSCSQAITIATHRGPRMTLEDRCLGVSVEIVGTAGDSMRRALLGVFDGVGGENAGAAAAQAACDLVRVLLSPLLVSDRVEHEGACLDAIRDALNQANEFVRKLAASDLDLSGMATTAVLGIVAGTRAVVAACGDSSAFLIRESRARQLTAPDVNQTHQVTEYLGRLLPPRIQTAVVDLEPGDSVVLVSDGVTDALDPSMIAKCVMDRGTIAPARFIVDAAVAEFTQDNASAVVLTTSRRSVA